MVKIIIFVTDYDPFSKKFLMNSYPYIKNKFLNTPTKLTLVIQTMTLTNYLNNIKYQVQHIV